MRLHFGLALLLLVSLLGCSPTAPESTNTCSAATCTGCCDRDGTCHGGAETFACGVAGGACDVCVSPQACVAGHCEVPNTGGGAGGGTGGGTGGGSGSTCAGALTECDGHCVDTLSSVQDCGRCGGACASGEVCNRGVCQALPQDCVVAGWCGPGTSCDPVTRTCVAGCRVAADCPTGAACNGGTCECPSGQHACGQRCVASDTPASCGGRCEACPGVDNGSATCSAGACGLSCEAGRKLCGGVCAACTTPVNATPVCSGTACDFTCNAGYHRCGNACAPDSSINACGAACVACPTSANGATACNSGTCSLTCNAGTRMCNGQCAVCTTPANATPVCSGTACDFACNAGFHRCGNQCVSDTSVNSCGSSCSPCAADANGTAACVAGSCQVTCNAGAMMCGTACSVCPTPPANGYAYCSGNACEWFCNTGYHRCGNQCLADDDASACGASCQACTAPANATALCVSGACVSECAPGWMKCDSGCCRAAAVSVGDAVACAVLTTGGVRCWGNNQQYQVGNNSSQNASTPQQVVGLTSGVASVSAGFAHVCALTTSGGAKCWGQGAYGELGNGNTNGASQPVDVQGLTSGVAQVVAAASNYSCALTTTGTVKCWGDNTYGRLGDGTTTSSLVPVDVPGLPSVAEVQPGAYHVCVRTTAGGVKCWGNNYKGQLGNGTTTSSLTPVDVTGLTSGVVALSSGGNFSCALLSTGSVKCWGSNLSYELGNGTTTSSSVPVTVSGLSSVVAISSGRTRSCAQTTAGGLKCWGSSATDVMGLTSGVTAFSAGDGTYCAVSGPGEVRCWGSNASGALGDGSTGTGRTAPGLVSGR